MSHDPATAQFRSIDIDLAAVVLLLAGLAALAGISVSTMAHDPDFIPLRAAGMAALMCFLGIGLWRRHEWARRSAIVAAVLVIHAQMMHRWLQSDVPHAVLDGLRGMPIHSVHDASSAHVYSSTLLALPPPEAGPAAFGLVLCLALAWLSLRLLSARVRAEFDGVYLETQLGRPAHKA